MKKILALFAILALAGCEQPKVSPPEVLAVGTVTGMSCETYNAGRFGGLIQGNCLTAVDTGKASPSLFIFVDEPKGVLGKRVIVVRSGERTRIVIAGDPE